MISSLRSTWPVRILVVLAVVVAYYAGSLRPAIGYHVGVPSSAENALSIEADGWTYGSGAPGGIPWTSAAGVFTEGIRPDCLPAAGTNVPVRFASIEVTVEGMTWRPIIWIDCRTGAR